MIRFIDIRDQGTGYRFAFWDTVRDNFIQINFECAWDNWKRFREDLELSNVLRSEWDRYKSLCPKWAFNDEEDRLEEWCAGELKEDKQ